jgi:ATP-dependent Zn protease
MLAKATANESKVNFMYCSATEFMEMYVGMGPKRVRSLFESARSKAPTIIFIDEIDSISMKRKN